MKPLAHISLPPASHRKSRDRVALWVGLPLLAAAGAWTAVYGNFIIGFVYLLSLLVIARLTHGFRFERESSAAAPAVPVQVATPADAQQQLASARAKIEALLVEQQVLQEQLEQERLLRERLHSAVEAVDISPWEMDVKERKTIWDYNRKALGLEDKTYEGGFRASMYKLIPPEDFKHVMRCLSDAVASRSDVIPPYQFRMFLPDGTVRHMRSRIRVMRDASGKALSILGATWDITKEVETNELLQRQTQQLHDTERRLERASLSSSEGHWEWDFIAETAWYSTSYHTLLGYRSGELPDDLHESLRKIQHPDDIEWQWQKFRNHIRQGDPYVFETRLKLANGEYHWFHVRGTAERDAHGVPIAMAGSIQDIHQQKLAEDALKLAQNRFERAINGTQDGLWELEADGQAWCSPRLLALLGHAHDEIASDTNFIREFLHPDDTEAVAAATQAHFQQGAPYDVEIRLRTKSGEYRWYRARATAERDNNGRPLRLSGSLQDVTEARAARDALLRATEAAESASRAKSSFLANVSHEIRTPMNGIIGMTGLLLDTSLDRTQRDYADTIRSSADSLLTIINDILDFSKIDAGKLVIESLPLDLRSNVEDVAVMLALQASAKNLEIIVNVDPAVPERVAGDPQRLRQCMINLLGNAIKFTQAGEIVIEVRVLERCDGKANIRFEVHDTGMGIAAETLKTLFQPFVQADSSTTRHFGGTGLGLSIVHRLVGMMDGQVGVESELGKGSTFWFTLPLPIMVDSCVELDFSRVGRRVLIVDDNAAYREFLANQLKHAGYEVSMAESGTEALSLLHRAAADDHPFEIALVDHQIADMDGAALGEKINADARLPYTRVVMLTSLSRQSDLRRLASLGFAGYLTKPVRSRELFARLDRVMQRKAGEWHLQTQSVDLRNALKEEQPSKRYAGNVLLTEDNVVNQKVAMRFLERLGCTVRVASNGAEAVKAYQEERFELILMDLQMPVMDGLAATRRIRELEGNARSTPIVALTANAMVGQLDNCLEAGMNGFLTKPLEVGRLREALDRFGLGVTPDSASSAGVQEGGRDIGAAPIDLARLREITDGDDGFAQELAQTFITSSAQVIEELRDALRKLDRGELSRAAHKLKGASANIHAESLRELTGALESQAAFAEKRVLANHLATIEREYQRVVDFFDDHVKVNIATVVGL